MPDNENSERDQNSSGGEFYRKMKRLCSLFIFLLCCFFRQRARTRWSAHDRVHTPFFAMHTCVGEKHTSQLSEVLADCGGRVCGMCASMTQFVVEEVFVCGERGVKQVMVDRERRKNCSWVTAWLICSKSPMRAVSFLLGEPLKIVN